jgi:uncharacterized membrane protein
MVQGIEIDSKKLSEIKKRDEKWLTKDLQDIKTTVEHYIDEVRPDNEKVENYIVKTPKSKVFNYVIIFLGIIGLIALIIGLFLLYNSEYLGGIPLVVFGGVFVLIFVLNILYKK